MDFGYVSPKYITPAQSELIQKMQLADRYKWTFDYIDELPIDLLGAAMQYAATVPAN